MATKAKRNVKKREVVKKPGAKADTPAMLDALATLELAANEGAELALQRMRTLRNSPKGIDHHVALGWATVMEKLGNTVKAAREGSGGRGKTAEDLAAEIRAHVDAADSFPKEH